MATDTVTAELPPPISTVLDNQHSVDVVTQFRKIEDALASARGKTLTQTLFADIISGLSNVKSAVIQCLSHPPSQSIPSPPVAISAVDPSVKKPSTPYADALKRASTNSTPNTNIRTAVLDEMKKSAIKSLESSSAEHFCNLELEDQQKRKSNAIIYGIREEDDPDKLLDSLYTTCAVAPPPNPPKITRLGVAQTNNIRPRPIRISFTCESDADKLFSNLSALKGNEDFKNISVRHDLTPHQADIRKDLATLAKQRSTEGKVFRVVGRPNDWRIVQARLTLQKQ